MSNSTDSTNDMTFTSEKRYQLFVSFKDFKGLKKVENIKENYKIGRVLGEGSFGVVRIAQHRKTEIKCITKRKT